MPMRPDNLQRAAAKSCEEGNYTEREKTALLNLFFSAAVSAATSNWEFKNSYRNGLNCSQPCKKGTNSRLKITADGKQSESSDQRVIHRDV